jgi:hypothetical protein
MKTTIFLLLFTAVFNTPAEAGPTAEEYQRIMAQMQAQQTQDKEIQDEQIQLYGSQKNSKKIDTGEPFEYSDPAQNPKIKVQIQPTDKAIECQLEVATTIYLCPNSGKPIFIKQSFFGFSALSRDKDNKPVITNISSVEAEDKVIFKAAKFPGSGGYGVFSGGFTSNSGAYENIEYIKPKKTLGDEYIEKVWALEQFFRPENFYAAQKTAELKPTQEYEKAAKPFLDELTAEKSKMQKAFEANSYQLELQDGRKISCERSGTRELKANEKEYEKELGKILCSSFQCESLTINGKSYRGILLYKSDGGGSGSNLHFFNQDGFAPLQKIRKITSSEADLPLVENSHWLDRKSPAINPYDSGFSALPQNLEAEKDALSFFKGPETQMALDIYKDLCLDDTKILSDLNAAKEKLYKKVSEAELVQIIKFLDGRVFSDLVDPKKAIAMGCSYEGVYLSKEAQENLELFKKNINPDKNTEGAISAKKAKELFNKAADMKDIAWKYKQDGCYARAHLMARRFEAEGVRVDKVWINGNLKVENGKEPIEWRFHVAPIVYVKDASGKIEKMVIDPSLFEGPVTVEEWDKKITKKTKRGSVAVSYPFPDNAASMERASIAFSSSDPYLPGEFISKGQYNDKPITEQEKMEMANEVMKQYKNLEK